MKLFESCGPVRADIAPPSSLPPTSEEELLNNEFNIPTLREMGYEEEPTSPFMGGETEALRRLHQYVTAQPAWVNSFAKPDTAPNSLEPSTTVLSPYLKFGCLSAAKFYHEVARINAGKVHTAPPVSLHGQLLWREFFYFQGFVTKNFDKMVGNPTCRKIPWEHDPVMLQAWQEGRTGFPFIDAIMTQLRVEGWIHHLARHAAACFLTRGDLFHHWEEGVRIFDLYLLDDDWALNNANWQWLSCSNFFYQYFRCYSPIAFGKKTDKEGLYIKKWLPQLANFPDKYIFEPWKAPLAVQQRANCIIGTVEPSSPLASLKRAVNSQKCIRAGGKHNDLEDVGKDTYHHTFFEMLGTWSFGDYFKKEAIDMAYDILVNTYQLDPNRLYASYFGGDDAMGLPCDTEARDYWLRYLPAERVLPFDRKANFWEMGDTGPCGPCSEIHYDRIGGGRDAAALVNADDPNVIEIWNLVFIQFNREPDGSLRPLPNKHIDTGMGLERLTSILQQKGSNYDTDVFMPLFDAMAKQIGAAPYTGLLGADDAQQNYRDTAYRVVADHIRTLTFSITDGAVPSNEGRGYVLRRILRRAVRYGMQTLGAPPGFLSALVPTVVDQFGDAFPELREKQAFVTAIIREEEESFVALLDKGVKHFTHVLDDLRRTGQTVIPGDQAFFLYDTLGFPIDLTQIMAHEHGFTVDTQAFEAAMLLQKERSRHAAKLKRLAGRVPLSLGAEQVAFLQQQVSSTVTQDLAKYQHDSLGLVLAATSFYAESGGQIADTGRLVVTLPSSVRVVLDVVDVQSYGGYVLHSCVLSHEDAAAEEEEKKQTGGMDAQRLAWRQFLRDVQEGRASLAEVQVAAEVDYARRGRIAPNHSMTHIAGLRAVFGEVYPDPVRVLSIGPAIDALLANPTDRAAWSPFSIEFCGGTHVKNTRDARAFAIIEETAVSKGIRRLTAVTGLDAQQTIARSQSLLAQIEAFQRDLHLATQPPQSQESRTSMETITAAISRMEATLSQFRVEIDTQLTERHCER
eukprot:gene7654-5502_t